MDKKKLLHRDEVPAEFKWRLEEIYRDDQAWETDFTRLQAMKDQAGTWQGRLGESADQLLHCLEFQDTLGMLLDKIYVYAQMRQDEDNARPLYQGMKNRAESLAVGVGEALAYVQPEILALPPDRLAGYLAAEPGLRLYRIYLEEITRMRPHTLTAREEELVAMTGEMGGSPRNIFKMLNDADMVFPEIRDGDGDLIRLTHGNYVKLMESRVRQVRQDAFQAMYSTYTRQKNTCAALYNASVKKDVFYSRVHRYPSALAASLDEDNVPLAVYDGLITAVRGRLDLMDRYIQLRKKVLALPELHLYDIYVPLVAETERQIPYPEAVATVQAGLAALGEEYGRDLARGFQSGWVDVLENEGKTSGAYSWGAYGTHPYVLMNYQGTLDHVFTLAHEMGHSLHSYYSWQKQPYVYSGYKIFVAEVASTVNEILLTRHLMATAPDREQKLYIINHFLEEFRGTVFRQTMFAEFEKEIHEAAEGGEPLTAESISALYYRLNRDYYGSNVVLDPEIAMEWARIPHFYNAFYVYKYATGFSAASALAKGILEEGRPAVDRYREFLAGGSSDYPIELLKKAGVDMTTPEPVNRALDVFAEMLTEMEKIL